MDKASDHFILTRDRAPLPDGDSDRKFPNRELAMLGAYLIARQTLKPVRVTRIRPRGEWTDVAIVIVQEEFI